MIHAQKAIYVEFEFVAVTAHGEWVPTEIINEFHSIHQGPEASAIRLLASADVLVLEKSTFSLVAGSYTYKLVTKNTPHKTYH